VLRLRGLRFAFANVGPLLGWALLNCVVTLMHTQPVSASKFGCHNQP
jgi:hypothetical protein